MGATDSSNPTNAAPKESLVLICFISRSGWYSLLSLCFICLIRASATEYVSHRVIPLVAGVLEKLIFVIPLELDENGPRLDPRLLINNRGPIFKSVIAGAGEFFDQL